MSDKAYITPKVLKWARESARITEEIAAHKANVSAEKLIEWESGQSHPTIRQAEILAKAYRRPLALLFLPNIPRDFQPLQDYRAKESTNLSTASIFIIREIQQKQAWISDCYSENNEKRLAFVGKYSIENRPADVAQDILKILNLEPNNYIADNPIKEWITNSEKNGIFVSRTSFINSSLKLDSSELQGFAISDAFAPFVFVNTEDWSSAQLFTLVHELAHIWIAESGVSTDIDYSINRDTVTHPVELFCNEVAANALMPDYIMQKFGESIYASIKDVYAVSRRLGVSTFAFLFRAFKLKIISHEKYMSLKIKAEKEFQSYIERENQKKNKQKEKRNGPNYYVLQLNKNGRLFTQTVIDSFRSGQIQPTQASALLNIKTNNFSKLEVQLYK